MTSILSTTKGLSSGYSRDLQQIKSSIWSTSKISITALIIIKSMLLELTVNEDKMRKAAEDGYLIALDLAEKLVQQKIPFRTAHNIVGNLVQIAHVSKKHISDLDINDINAISLKTIKQKKLLHIIQGTTISSSLKNRRSKGSSGISEQTRMISQRTKRISLYRNSIKKQNSVVKRSFDSLSKRVKTLTK